MMTFLEWIRKSLNNNERNDGFTVGILAGRNGQPICPETSSETVMTVMVSQEHYMKMMNCLIENYHKDCSSMDLINTLNEIDDTMEVFH